MIINAGQSEIYNVQNLNKRYIKVSSTEIVTIDLNGMMIKAKDITLNRLSAKLITIKNENASSVDVTITEE